MQHILNSDETSITIVKNIAEMIENIFKYHIELQGLETLPC